MMKNWNDLIDYSFSFFLHDNLTLVTCSQARVLSFRPLVLPLWQDTVLCILSVLLLYPNVFMSSLSLRLPSFRWPPKYSSTGSWQNRSVRTNSNPSWSKNFVTSTAECTDMQKPSYVCHERNIRFLVKGKTQIRKMKINIQENFTEIVNKQSHMGSESMSSISTVYRSCTYIFRNLLHRSVFHR